MVFISLNFKLCLGILLFIAFGHGLEDSDDLHSSITALKEAFITEKLYIENSEIFLEYSSRILNALRSKLHEIKSTRPSNISEEITLERKLRLQYRLNNILGSNYIGFARNISSFANTHKFPTDIDLEGAAQAISRLQDVYGFSAKEIASGSFLNLEDVSHKNLKSSDCFLIGFKLFKLGEKTAAEEWFNLAYDRYDRTQIIDERELSLEKPFPISIILDFLAHSKFRFDDVPHVEMAIQLIQKAISEDPEYEHLYKQLDSYEKVLRLYMNTTKINTLQEKEYYRIACRGEARKSSELTRQLYCIYKNGLHPFLKLAPIKVEIKNINPYVMIFHDVLYENEIEMLQLMSMGLLSRATVYDAKESKSVLSHSRTSKHGWLYDDMDPLLNILNQRMEDMTDMTMETSEALQVMNYGIGGHYDIHPDYLNEPKENETGYANLSWGNRVATLLFYMSNVEQGGSTVFPHISTVAQPNKGAAAFWFNMLPSGLPDYKVRHAACPVIFGSKWGKVHKRKKMKY
ncbi:prolyl 4-hydroxylase subunit alpha-2-like [Condylostylus longicornis]|uniref:prolyl 4-hydroxylase subunit alpha-2-like n=1 Tax=Condylostylus longicornis TaxID=2530218 RepID=UPI00244E22CF|nr:prolyl 4-hydroxylase subunit alpha-2-like [Condylostylus longicornis]